MKQLTLECVFSRDTDTAIPPASRHITLDNLEIHLHKESFSSAMQLIVDKVSPLRLDHLKSIYVPSGSFRGLPTRNPILQVSQESLECL